jgi:hypothetical protein
MTAQETQSMKQHNQELEARKKASSEANEKRRADYNASIANAANAALAKFTPTAYVAPTDGLTLDAALKLSDNDLLTALKKQRDITAASFRPFHRDLGTLVVLFDAVVERFSDQGRHGAARHGKLTLREAFTAIGWNYDAARTMKQRWLKSHDPVPDYVSAPKPPQLSAGDLVMVPNKDGVYVVAGDVDVTSETVPVVPRHDQNAKPKAVAIADLQKKKVPRKKINVDDLVIFDDEKDVEYRYAGKGKFVLSKTPPVAQTKAEKDADAARTKAEKEATTAKARQKAQEKEDEKKRRNAEATRRDLDKIAKAKAAKENAPPKKGPKAAIKPAANTKTVKVEKVDGTQEFGVFPESCTVYTAANALTIGTRQMCSAECDRINAKRKSVASAA